jgi:hemoglobin
MPSAQMMSRLTPELSFLAAVSLHFEAPRSIGQTPDGVRFHFMLQGTLDGPQLKGKFPLCAAYLLVDVDGIGTINVRAPLLIDDGATAELEATGRYDFGADGYQRAAAGDLPNSALGWCPRFTSEHPRYVWLNRVLHLGVGELRPRETRVDYDLFLLTVPDTKKGSQYPGPRPPISPSCDLAPTMSSGTSASVPALRPEVAVPGEQPSLYTRLGGQAGIDGIARDFVDALLGNVRLNRQNQKVAVAHSTVRGEKKQRAVKLASDMFCKLTGGPCEHILTRSLKESHVHLDITESDWDIMRGDLERVLVKHRVLKPEREALMAIVEGTKTEIVRQS